MCDVDMRSSDGGEGWFSFPVVVVLTAPHPGRADKNAGRHEEEWI